MKSNLMTLKPFVYAFLIAIVLVGSSRTGSAQIGKRFPSKIGYVYPAGGQRGTTFEVWVAGRQLSRTIGAVFSGKGITAQVVDHTRLFVNQDQRDRYMVRNRIGDVAGRLVSETPEGKLMKELVERLPKVNKPPDPPEEIEAVPFVWPRVAAIRKIGEPDAVVPLEEMLEIIYRTYGPEMWRRPIDVLHEVVVLEVTIAHDAEPGDRELRLVTNMGLTNPMYFQVGIHPEFMEREPNNYDIHYIATLLQKFPAPVYDTPIVLNGQITHSDIDRFPFRAKKGESLILNVQARRLMPYLADGVPGWFEAIVSVYDEKGREIAYADCHRFDPDPLLVFTPPADGVYIAEVRDSLYRGREDFVYRLTIAPTPLVESVFPLGLKEGTSQTLHLNGKNLAAREVKVDASPGPNNIRELGRIGSQWLPDPIRYEVDSLPEVVEAAGNQTRETAQAITLPTIVNGRISKPGEYDFYRFDGKEGEQVVFEVTARRLNSPLDSRIALLDGQGKILAENDDGGTIDEENNYMSYLIGLQTHNADSKLTATLPSNGPFFLRIGDATRQGGEAYAYRLRFSKPRPDFVVYTTPSASTLLGGNCNHVWFYVDRKENYNGPIELRLVGETQGFQLDGGIVQPGENEAICTLSTPNDPLRKPIPLQFEAVAVQDGTTIRRLVHPVEDMEQAFLYHHWMPSDHFWVLLNSRRASTGFRPVKTETLVLKQGQSVDVEFESTAPWIAPTTIYYLKDAPPGVGLRKKSQENKRLTLTVSVAADTLQKAAEKEYLAAHPPTSDDGEGKKKEETKPVVEPKKSIAGNLLIVVDAETVPKNPEEKKTRYSLGFLPAVPFRIEP